MRAAARPFEAGGVVWCGVVWCGVFVVCRVAVWCRVTSSGAMQYLMSLGCCAAVGFDVFGVGVEW